MIAMLVMFRPSAVRPPSANSRHWMIRTVETQSAPTHGPTRMTARVPPSRCPETPGSTWKLSICTAKMNAATSPAIGASLSSRSARARHTQKARASAAKTAKIAETGPFTIPLAMCIA